MLMLDVIVATAFVEKSIKGVILLLPRYVPSLTAIEGNCCILIHYSHHMKERLPRGGRGLGLLMELHGDK